MQSKTTSRKRRPEIMIMMLSKAQSEGFCESIEFPLELDRRCMSESGMSNHVPLAKSCQKEP